MTGSGCDIIIPVFNALELTKGCLGSIKAMTHSSYSLILIDNGSSDETHNFLKNFKLSAGNAVLIRNNENLGWVKAVNQGLKASKSDYVCIMNNDTVVLTDNWLARLIGIAEEDGSIGLVNPTFSTKKEASKIPYVEIDFCRGYCMLIKRQVIDKIGGLDESYGLGYYDDDDYSVRAIRAGFRCVRANNVVVEHLRDSTFSAMFEDTTRRALHEKNKQLFYSKWGKRLRIAFVITKAANRKALADLFLSLARRQHIVYLWNLTAPFSLEHINIRENHFRPLFTRLRFSLELYLNSMKRSDKRYSAIFVDSAKYNLMPHCDAHYFNIEKNVDLINSMVDSAAKA